MSKLNLKQIQQAAITIWAVWNGRNGEIHGEPKKSAMMVANFVKNYLQEYNQAQVRENLITGGRHNHWTPPCVDRYKVNFDGAFDKSSTRGGIGVIIRNSEGFVMRAHIGHKERYFLSS